jgi:DNA-binding IclR family transcriptional regulator
VDSLPDRSPAIGVGRPANSKSVPSLDRALAVLELLSQTRRGFTMSEISQRLKLPKSSTHLILGTLVSHGYLHRSAHTGRYSFGLKLISLSRNAIENFELVEEAKPFLQALMHRTGLTVHLALLEGNEAVIIDKVDPPGPYRITTTWLGRRVGAHCTGIGKALLAHLSDEDFQKQIASQALWRYNHKTICSIGRLRADLRQIRKMGFALSDEESQIGFRGIGAAIVQTNHGVVGAISVDGTIAQISLDDIPNLGECVRRTAAAISSHLNAILPVRLSSPQTDR